MSTQLATERSLGERRYDLDWVRICAFMLLIFYHAGMYYVTWDFHVKSPHASHAIEPLMQMSSPWRLSLLFFISGVATAFLMQKTRTKGFLGQRSIRLLVPLLFGMAVIVPPQSYLEVVEKLSYTGSYFDFLKLYFTAYHGFCHNQDCLILPTWNHLWFVAYLWVYTAVLYGIVKLVPSFTRRLHNIAERHMAGMGVLVWPILFLIIARLILIDRFPVTHALVDDWYNHAIYGATFLLGFALAGARAPWKTIENVRWIALGSAILGWAFIVSYDGTYDHLQSHAPWGLWTLRRCIYSAEQWTAIVAVLGFAKRHLTHDNAARRYLTSAIFPVYILHQTVIIVVAHNIQTADMDPRVEGVLLVLVTATASLLGYEIIRRVPLLRPLFGLSMATQPKLPPARPFPEPHSDVA